MIKEITTTELANLIYSYNDPSLHEPWMRGVFIVPPYGEVESWTAVDNTTWDCFVEQFTTKEMAEAWLNREFEMSDFYHYFGNGACTATIRPEIFNAWLNTKKKNQ